MPVPLPRRAADCVSGVQQEDAPRQHSDSSVGRLRPYPCAQGSCCADLHRLSTGQGNGMSRPIPAWVGTVDKDGKLRLEARALFDRYLSSLKNSAVSLVIKKRTRAKSQSQLGYLWGAVYPVIAEELGYQDYEIDALHDALMRKLCGLKPDPNPLQLRVSLSEMAHDEVSAYISDVRFFALTDLGITTPDADKVEYKPRGKRAA